MVVLVDVMLRVPLLLPALTVEPPPTWATADELTTDSAIAASTGFKALPPTFGSDRGFRVDRGGRVCPDHDVPAGSC